MTVIAASDMALEGIRTVNIPRPVVAKTFEFLRTYGKQKNEAHAIWVGKENDTDIFSFAVSDVWFPKQYNTAVAYVVPEQEIHRINVKLNAQRLIAIAQIHTHPGEAFHSGIDDDGSSLLSLPGSFSIVIPDYGFVSEDDIENWAIYRYIAAEEDEWEEVRDPEVKMSLFRIT